MALSVTVENTGDRAGSDLVQVYLHDPAASVVRPVQRLIGYARVEPEPGERVRVPFHVHADLTSFTGRDGRRLVEPGAIVQTGSASRRENECQSVSIAGVDESQQKKSNTI